MILLFLIRVAEWLPVWKIPFMMLLFEIIVAEWFPV